MDSEKIGIIIKEIRTNNKLTQQEFANKYGVTYQAVSKWENGKNLPDIMLLKQICKDYNYSIDELLEGSKKKNKTKKVIITILILLCLFFSLLLLFLKKDSYRFKTISSNCSEFKITGSIAYDKKKSSIYISDVSYCGKKDDTIYKSINCVLYEKNNDDEKEIKRCDKDGKNVSMDSYLKDISIMIDDYNQTCKDINDNSLFLKINAIEQDNKMVSYKIPLLLNEGCKSN